MKADYQTLLAKLRQGKPTALITFFPPQASPHIPLKLIFQEDKSSNYISQKESIVFNSAQEALQRGSIKLITNADEKRILIEPFYPQEKLIILGGGHIGKALEFYALPLGFNVTVVDDREDFANRERFLGAHRVLCANFSDCFSLLDLDAFTYVVIVTRGHRHDLICLEQALQYETAYTGMIGSLIKIKGVKEELLAKGCSSQALENIYAPIGLDIGAVNPEEIAIAILAQIIQVKRSRFPQQPEYDRDVLTKLACGGTEQIALATIIATQGSVPRRAGSKMLVFSDGTILGSIGGGLCEGEVLRLAKKGFTENRHQFYSHDLTGKAAEDAGMVCGGRMELVIEWF